MKPFGGMGFPPGIRWGDSKEGIVWRKDTLDEFMANGGGLAALIGDGNEDLNRPTTDKHGMGLMAMEQKLREATDETEAAFKRFDEARQKFRSEIRNEVQSVEAAARKLSAESARVAAAIMAIRDVYTSADFVLAVANAERLAAALKALQDLDSSRLTFAVIDNKTESKP